MNFFDKCKQCSIVVGNGSGVLFQPENANYSYVLTAKHNLKKKEEKNKKNLNFDFIKIYKHESLDIAIIKIKKHEFSSPQIKISELKDKEVYKLYGYPSKRREQDIKIKIQAFDLEVRDIHNEYEVIVFNKDYDAEQVDIDGCSGGGVFEEKGFLLVGIECRMDKELNDEENNTRLRFISIKAFDEVVEKYSDELVYLDSTKNYSKKYKEKKDKIVVGSKSFVIKTVNFKSDKYNLNVAIYPVTYSQYDLFCKDKGKDIVDNYKKINREVFPVVNIRWNDALLFCEWLTENSQKSNKYKLPKSDEWEFIANENMSEDNIYCNSRVPSEIGTNFGKKGLYDFLGNIEEFCEDKVRKGGCYKDKLSSILNIKREKKITNSPKREVGFRIVSIVSETEL